MQIQHFFDQATYTLTYVVYDETTRIGVVIDSLTDFDPASGRVDNRSSETVAAFLKEHKLTVPYVLDTHAHADHLTGLEYFRQQLGCKTVIGERITVVQQTFSEIFNLGRDFPVDASQFDILMNEGDTLDVGPFSIHAIHTPGHTPACMSYQIGDALFVGDALFMPDYGTGRCDFPGGSASDLYDSISKLYALPDTTRVFTCHDYQPGGRELRFVSTIGEEKASNIQLGGTTSREEYIEFRTTRDAKLSMPRLLLPSLQVNIRAGVLPEPEDNGVSYLKLPLNRL
jgi:glyoxylase-like metal-dependent hydrolase (beta-lactamase superfamily II)